MRIRFTIDIERRRRDDDFEPWNDTAAHLDRAEYTDGPQVGFTREPYWDTEEGRRGRRTRSAR